MIIFTLYISYLRYPMNLQNRFMKPFPLQVAKISLTPVSLSIKWR